MQTRPLVIGIAGGTGSGKSTVARRIVSHFRDRDVAHIQHDAYYKHLPELSPTERAAVNFDHPESLDNDLLIRHIDELVGGRAIERPEYNFTTHLRYEQTVSVAPAPILIVEGILIFADPRLTERMDLKLFVDTPADIRVLRRVRRDLEKRGRDFASVRLQYYTTVRPMHIAFVEPSKSKADLIIPEGGNNAVAIGVIVERIRAQLVDHHPAPRRRNDTASTGAAQRRKTAD